MSKEIKVAYQGMPGAYSEKATRQLLGKASNIHAIGYNSFEEAFLAVEREQVNFGVLPIENSLGGSIHATYDLLLKYGLHIVGEYDLRVEHSLLVLPGVKKEDIKTVISHPQALAQCDNTIAQMHAKPRPEFDTAGSAKMLADNGWKDTAAIASDLAAEYYGLEILENNVEDDPGNFTRFLLLSKHEDMGLEDIQGIEFKTSIVFSFVDRNEQGQLYKALSAFSLRDIDLTKIESRPWGFSAGQQLLAEQDSGSSLGFDTTGEFSLSSGLVADDRRKYKYLFYVDIIGYHMAEPVMNALRHVQELCKFVRVLGSYPTKGKLLGNTKAILAAAGIIAPTLNSPVISPASPVFQPKPVSSIPKLNIGIYGFGTFGQFLAKTFCKYHKIRVTSRSDYSSRAKELNVDYFPASDLESFFAGLDVIVICVSILSFEKVISSLINAGKSSPNLQRSLDNVIFVDVLSVKTHPKQKLLSLLPTTTSILCTHPMFGPESGKYTWRGLPLMYEKVRTVSDHHAQAITGFLHVFEVERCRMLDMTCEDHDAFAASSQFLTHLTGRILSEQGVKSTPIDTRGFKSLVQLVDDTCKDSFDLFQGLYEFNPESEAQIQRFHDSMRAVTTKLQTLSKSRKSSPDESLSSKYPLNPLVHHIAPSKTVVIHGLTQQLKAEGKKVWSLCVGEPDFNPHDRVLNAGSAAFENGVVKYTDVKGTLELRKLIAEYMAKVKKVQYDPTTEILISNGAKQSVYQALLAICKQGDKVIIPSPYWVSYPDMVRLVNAEPVILRTTAKEQYLVTPESLERTLEAHPDAKALILCNPSNPTGTLHLPDRLQALAKVLNQPKYRHVLIIADEIYEQLIFQDRGVPKRIHQCFATLPEMFERTLVINGFSKSHAMTGLRIGFLAAPKYFTQVCAKLQGQITSGASSVGQYASCEAMNIELEYVNRNEERIVEVLEGLDIKRQYVLQRLNGMPHVGYAHPIAAFYVFVDMGYYFPESSTQGKTKLIYVPNSSNAMDSCDDFVEYVLREHHVALVPGSAFGEKAALRISYASSLETLEHAMDGLENALKSLHIIEN